IVGLKTSGVILRENLLEIAKNYVITPDLLASGYFEMLLVKIKLFVLTHLPLDNSEHAVTIFNLCANVDLFMPLTSKQAIVEKMQQLITSVIAHKEQIKPLLKT